MAKVELRTLRYSFVISWYSLVMVLGGSRAIDLMATKMTKEMAIPMVVYRKTVLPSPGGSRARGPCGPNAIQYAVLKRFIRIRHS